jgi:environmental stress-induced protein Ves
MALLTGRRMPWKNGGGFTTELIRQPDSDYWNWRVSVAEIAVDGPFSKFEGIDRTLVVIEGAGMELRHPSTGSVARLEPLVPYEFPGEIPTDCTLLHGAVRDFNVMTRRGWTSARVEILPLAPAAEATRQPSLLYCVEGDVSVSDGNSTVTLSKDAALLSNDETLTLHSQHGATVIALFVTRNG